MGLCVCVCAIVSVLLARAFVTDINECATLNDLCGAGNCENTMGSYSCNCPIDYTGLRCETGKCMRKCENVGGGGGGLLSFERFVAIFI